MKYIKLFKIFENTSQTEEEKKEREEKEQLEKLMGKYLHLYGSIPITKDKAAEVIPKMLVKVYGNNGPGFTLENPVMLNSIEDFKTRLRFLDYFDSILQFKETRGHNFEGLVAGLYGGVLSTSKSSKADLTINGEGISVKFIDQKGKAPEIGSFKDIFDKDTSHTISFMNNIGADEVLSIKDYVVIQGGLTRIFQDQPSQYIEDQLRRPENWKKIKEKIASFIFSSTDMLSLKKILIAYTSRELSDVENDPLNGLDKINIDVITMENLKKMILAGFVVSPKGGKDSYFSLALSTKYRKDNKEGEKNFITSAIFLPKPMTKEEFLAHFDMDKEKDWMTDVFGPYISRKIRPDVAIDIKNNREHIIKKLSEWDKIWNENK
jgi:hypothetical protein